MKKIEVRTIRGVNLGGWLVLEKWITPSLFQGVEGPDEWSLSTELSYDKARRRLKQHRETFITEKHIEQIASMGLNTVRVPVGYWLFEDVDGFIGGGNEYIERLFEWTQTHGLGVILCIHAAPGSQNGWDHSGRAGTPLWHMRANRIRTLQFVRQLSESYGQQETLVGIELLNEPHPEMPLQPLVSYYRRARRVVAKYCRLGVRSIVSDAFRPHEMVKRLRWFWGQRPVLDIHRYQLFTVEDRQLDFAGHMAKVASWRDELTDFSKKNDVLVGEWSAAMDELYEPVLSKKARHYTKAQYHDFARRQKRAFEAADCGWCYWTARTEDGGVWSLLDHSNCLTK